MGFPEIPVEEDPIGDLLNSVILWIEKLAVVRPVDAPNFIVFHYWLSSGQLHQCRLV